jgi:aminopeptidase YwaD
MRGARRVPLHGGVRFSAEGVVRRMLWMIASGLVFSARAIAQKPPLLPEKDVAALAQELSGETAKRNLEGLARLHRQRGSRGFHSAAELVAERARAYGLSDVTILQFPADGKIFYGTQRSRPAWDAEFAELWQVVPDAITCDEAAGRKPQNADEARKENPGKGSACDVVVNKEIRRLASYEAEPVVLAEDSESTDVIADLVDVGEGTKESDYAGKDVKGKIVLTGAQPGAVQDLAVGKLGAAGIVSYAQNQKTAWWGEDENLIRWGHLETFSANKTFGFMISLKTARAMRERLAEGEKILLHATVKAGQHPGNYEVVTATIPGADPKLKKEEIAFSCHLDHQRPGANDNASGCVTILEVARTLQKLIHEEKLARPARSIRFIWPPEVEGTVTLLNAKPEFAQRIKAVIHMDMVGGGLVTKAVFHVTRGPMSLPSFVHDVAWAFADFVNEQSYKFATTGSAEYPFVAPEGGKEPLQARFGPYTMGSDHDVYQDSSFKIPSIYLNDWPDRYIHTNFDTAANIDPTKLQRAAFIGATSGYFLAGMTVQNVPELRSVLRHGAHLWRASIFPWLSSLSAEEAVCIDDFREQYDWAIEMGLDQVLHASLDQGRVNKMNHPGCAADKANSASNGGNLRFVRKPEPRGPLAVFGYDYLADRGGPAGIPTPKLLGYEGLRGAGEEYAYETLNFVDGVLDAQQIRDRVAAEYGPVPLEVVVEYLRALEKVGVLEQAK